jgi:hypothetical protein
LLHLQQCWVTGGLLFAMLVQQDLRMMKFIVMLMVDQHVNQVEHPSRRTCRDTLPPNARLLLLARLRMSVPGTWLLCLTAVIWGFHILRRAGHTAAAA